MDVGFSAKDKTYRVVYLNTLSPVGGTVWEQVIELLGPKVLQVEVCHYDQTLRVYGFTYVQFTPSVPWWAFKV